MSVNITVGRIGQHTPKNAGAGGRDAAVIDIAQDLLLREVHAEGALDGLVFKGGTALRKLYAGNDGRFSTDLDFSLAHASDDPEDVLLGVIDAIDGRKIGPFSYGVRERRGKWALVVDSPFTDGEPVLSSKIDISPPVWLNPVTRGWVPMGVHASYGDPPLPELQTIRIEENLAEKISRLNRTTTARDMYDLRWLAEHQGLIGGIDMGLVRRLSVLKIWVDANGFNGGRAEWKRSHESAPFDPDHWLRVRNPDEFDLEDIGALTVPPPTADELTTAVADRYRFLADLDEVERQIALARGQDRQVALKALADLPDRRLGGLGLY